MKTYGWPLVLFLSSVIGLVTMLLVENDLGDNVGLLLLVLPLAVLARYSLVTPPASR
ncbi:MAG: hypothetical protein ABW352_19745 [Polyangiales bacterium]